MNDFITCEICKKQLKMLNNKHLQTHSISIIEYKKLIPEINKDLIFLTDTNKYNI